MKVIDCFMFYNETEVLEKRLIEIYDVVDHIILVEATTTHTGKPKALFYEPNPIYKDKIIHVVTNFQEGYNFNFHDTRTVEWMRENYQRECIQIELKKMGLAHEDVIMCSDADEIVSRETVEKIKNGEITIQNNTLYAPELSLYYYSIEYTTPRKWYHAKIFNYHTFKLAPSLTHIRMFPNYTILPGAGWHLTYFGGIDLIKTKVESFAESKEYPPDGKEVEYLKYCLENNILHFNKEKLIHLPLETNANVPRAYLKTLDK